MPNGSSQNVAKYGGGYCGHSWGGCTTVLPTCTTWAWTSRTVPRCRDDKGKMLQPRGPPCVGPLLCRLVEEEVGAPPATGGHERDGVFVRQERLVSEQRHERAVVRPRLPEVGHVHADMAEHRTIFTDRWGVAFPPPPFGPLPDRGSSSTIPRDERAAPTWEGPEDRLFAMRRPSCLAVFALFMLAAGAHGGRSAGPATEAVAATSHDEPARAVLPTLFSPTFRAASDSGSARSQDGSRHRVGRTSTTAEGRIVFFHGVDAVYKYRPMSCIPTRRSPGTSPRPMPR